MLVALPVSMPNAPTARPDLQTLLDDPNFVSSLDGLDPGSDNRRQGAATQERGRSARTVLSPSPFDDQLSVTDFESEDRAYARCNRPQFADVAAPAPIDEVVAAPETGFGPLATATFLLVMM